VRRLAQLREAAGLRLHALDDHAVELLVGEITRQFARVAGKEDTQVDPVARVGGLDLQQLVLKPVQAGIVRAGADEPDADPALLGQVGLGTAPAAERSRDIVVLLHHGTDSGQAVCGDQLRLVYSP